MPRCGSTGSAADRWRRCVPLMPRSCSTAHVAERLYRFCRRDVAVRDRRAAVTSRRLLHPRRMPTRRDVRSAPWCRRMRRRCVELVREVVEQVVTVVRRLQHLCASIEGSAVEAVNVVDVEVGDIAVITQFTSPGTSGHRPSMKMTSPQHQNRQLPGPTSPGRTLERRGTTRRTDPDHQLPNRMRARNVLTNNSAARMTIRGTTAALPGSATTTTLERKANPAGYPRPTGIGTTESPSACVTHRRSRT
jgi:hypothetical protein